jgi:hypothetical protein
LIFMDIYLSPRQDDDRGGDPMVQAAAALYDANIEPLHINRQYIGELRSYQLIDSREIHPLDVKLVLISRNQGVVV